MSESAKIKLVNECKSSPVQSVNTLKVKLNKLETNDIGEVRIHGDFQPFQLIIGKKVKHKEEGIIGEIKFIGSEKVAIAWEDNTRERMDFNEARKNLEYIDDVLSLKEATEVQASNVHVNEILDNAIKALDENFDDTLDLIVQAKIESTDKVDVEKIKLQRKVNELEDKLNVKQTNTMKEKIANELIDVAILKGIIDEDERELEAVKIMAFNDEEFENYKSSILEYDSDGNAVTSTFSPAPIVASDAELTLKKIKATGGKGIIGDFSNQLSVKASANTISNNVSSSSERRALGEIKDRKFTWENKDEKIPTFEEQFENILSNRLANAPTTSRKKEEIPVQKELKGFENLQGLTKPLRVPDKPASSFPTNSTMKDLFGNLDWTTISKVH